MLFMVSLLCRWNLYTTQHKIIPNFQLLNTYYTIYCRKVKWIKKSFKHQIFFKLQHENFGIIQVKFFGTSFKNIFFSSGSTELLQKVQIKLWDEIWMWDVTFIVHFIFGKCFRRELRKGEEYTTSENLRKKIISNSPNDCERLVAWLLIWLTSSIS